MSDSADGEGGSPDRSHVDTLFSITERWEWLKSVHSSEKLRF